MMTSPLSTDRFDRVVMARMAATPVPRPKQLLESVRRFWPGASETDIAGALERLEREGLAAGGSLVKRGQTAAEELGVAARPWKQVAEVVLPISALGWDPESAAVRKQLDDREKWAAAVVARDYGLIGPKSSVPTPAAVANILVWRRLGLSGKVPKALPSAVAALFVSRVLGAEVTRWERALFHLALKSVGAGNAELRTLRDGVVKMWLGGRTWTEPARSLAIDPLVSANGADDSHEELEAIGRPEDLEGFAGRVRDAARRARNGVFGDRKVFISALWRDLGSHAGCSLDEFKQRLVEANRRGLLRLYRADLVEEMDPAEVAASATSHMDATFHFVEREASP